MQVILRGRRAWAWGLAMAAFWVVSLGVGGCRRPPAATAEKAKTAVSEDAAQDTPADEASTAQDSTSGVRDDSGAAGVVASGSRSVEGVAESESPTKALGDTPPTVTPAEQLADAALSLPSNGTEPEAGDAAATDAATVEPLAPTEPPEPADVVDLDEAEEATEPAEPASNPLGARLYARHCAACHGPDGNGQGVAARFLFPKPRDFRAGRFRLVSTANNVPDREDLNAVLLRGMPGSSMPPWRHLSQEERDALVDEIMRLRREGAREIYVRMLKEQEQLTDEEIAEEDIQEEIADYVESFSTPGERTPIPPPHEPTTEELAEGREIYVRTGCIQCHGTEGKGDGVQAMFDDEKYPTAPRDFTAGIFKGGDDVASLYRRIAYGMPGTPMPSARDLKPEQIVALAHYILSLSTPEQREAVVLNRETIVARRAASLPQSPDDPAWNQLPAIMVRMMPLWWRNGADPGLEVRALHDGNTLAIHLSWRDATHDDRAIQSNTFEDAVAVELYRGDDEPFLGMGMTDSPIDVWFWDADRQTRSDVEHDYPRMVADIYPFSETRTESAEYDRPATRRQQQPAASLAAVAAGNMISPSVADESAGGASSLVVSGPGTVTFRPAMSQQVRAVGTWADGRWAVLMSRPLAIDADSAAMPLAPGDRLSVAFAVWDGSLADRDGKKLVTIWQDFELEGD